MTFILAEINNASVCILTGANNNLYFDPLEQLRSQSVLEIQRAPPDILPS